MNNKNDSAKNEDKLQLSVHRKPKRLTMSIKMKSIGGCFHRDHSPKAYQMIDRYLESSILPKEDLLCEE